LLLLLLLLAHFVHKYFRCVSAGLVFLYTDKAKTVMVLNESSGKPAMKLNGHAQGVCFVLEIFGVTIAQQHICR
jgi:hypothetical protein